MLLRNLRNKVQSVNTLQLVLAISVGLEGSYWTTKGIVSASTVNLVSYVANEKKVNNNTNNLKSVIKYFMEYNVLNAKTAGRYVSKTNLNGALKAEGLPTLSFEKHYEACMQILQNYDYSDLTYLFLSTSYATRDIHAVIKKDITKIYGVGHATRTVIDAVYKDFCKFFYESSRHKLVYQDNMSTDLLGFYVNTLGFYAKGGQAYSIYVNETDQDSIIQGGDYATSALDLYTVEKKKHTVDIDFQDVANRIAAASCLLYSHSNKQVALYDIYTKYNSQRVGTIVNELKSSCQALIPYIKIENNWDDIETSQSHIRNKKTNRDNTAQSLFVLAENPVRIEELNKLYNAARKADDAEAFNKNQGPQLAKDGLYIFSTIGHKVKGRLKNSEKFQILVEGFNALRELREYLADNDIEPLSIPVDIFRDMNLPRRYFSLESYLDLHYVTSSLIEEEKNRNTELKGALHNDELYDTLVMGCFDKNNRLNEFMRKSSTLKDIKYAVEQYGKCNDENEFISAKALEAFKLTQPIIKPIKVLIREHYEIKENKIYYVGKVLDENNIEEMKKAKFLEMSTKNFFEVIKQNMATHTAEELQNYRFNNTLPICERYSIVDIHFSEENITTWITDNPPDTSSPEKREFISKTYNRCEEVYGLIAEGGLSENTISRVFQKYSAVENIINSDNFEMLEKEVQEKLIFFFTNALEILMKAENHPVSEGRYYALKGLNLQDEFSYLNSEVQIANRCNAIKKSFKILCGNDYYNEFEMFNFLLVSSKMLQYYYFTNRKIIGKSRNLYNGVTPVTENSKSLDNKAVNDFINDGDFAVLIRAGVFINYLDRAVETGDFNTLPLDKFTNNYYLHYDTDYDLEGMINRMKLLLINLSNAFIKEHKEIYDFLKYLAKAVHKNFDSTCRNMTVTESPEIISLLGEAVIKARAFAMQNTDDVMQKTMLKITANAICDPNGYIMNYGRLFRNKEGEFLHCSGVWVKLPTSKNSEVSYRLFNDYKQFEGVLNFIYD